MLSRLVLRDFSFTAVVSLLVEYSKTSASSYNVSFPEARITDVGIDLDLCGLVQSGFYSAYRRYVRVTKVV